jgi:exopolysaccharide biosynthesis polyprenyl glycosylphosphotransferase
MEELGVDQVQQSVKTGYATNAISIPYQAHADKSRIKPAQEWRIYLTFLVIIDLTLIFAAFWAAYYIRFTLDIPIFHDGAFSSPPFYSRYMLYVLPVWGIIYALAGLYMSQNLLGGTNEYKLLFNATTFGMLFNITTRFALPDSLILARGWVVMAWILAFLFTAIGRFCLRRVVYQLRKYGYFQKKALLIGLNEEGNLLYEQLNKNQQSGLHLMGYVCHKESDCDDSENIPYLGELADIQNLIDTQKITTLILTSSALSQEQVLSVFRQYGTLKDIDLRMSSGLYEIITTGMSVKEEGLVPLVVINKVRLEGVDQVMKLIVDYTISFFAVLILSPLLLLIALAVKLSSPGPIIYRRRVMGVNGRQFDAFKFRTMDQRSDEILASNPELLREYMENFKIKVDPRVTRIGKFLRKTSLDELPQLFNVLRNEMSLVGPRMITPQELEKYDQWDINLLTVKPGITGLWQVRGRSEIVYNDRVRIDMHYIRNWSIWLDLQIILQTIPAVLSKRGAF